MRPFEDPIHAGAQGKGRSLLVLLFVMLELLVNQAMVFLSSIQRLASNQTALFWLLVEILQAALWGASTFLLVNGYG